MYNIFTGVPQWPILGPLLFIIYNNDLWNDSKLFMMTIYADNNTDWMFLVIILPKK